MFPERKIQNGKMFPERKIQDIEMFPERKMFGILITELAEFHSGS